MVPPARLELSWCYSIRLYFHQGFGSLVSKCLIHWKNSAHLLYLLILHELLSIASIIATQNTPIRVGIANSKLTEKFLKKGQYLELGNSCYYRRIFKNKICKSEPIIYVVQSVWDGFSLLSASSNTQLGSGLPIIGATAIDHRVLEEIEWFSNFSALRSPGGLFKT